MDLRRYVPIACLLIGVVALQVILTAAGATYYMTQLTMAVYYSLVAVGLCLLMGYAGQVSLGHAGFFAIGGYCSACLTTWNLLPHADSSAVRILRGLGLLLQRRDIYDRDIIHVSPWLAFAVAMLLAACTALVIGVPAIRLKGHYLAMATLGFGVIVYRVVLGTPWLGEADGFSDVPPFRMFPFLEINGRAAFRISNYYAAWAAVAVVMVLAVNLVRSRVGRALRAIHEGEEAAHSLGIDVARCKLAVFVISAILAALAGVLMTHYNGGIGPSEATAMKSIRYVAIVAVGGMANLWGALVMGTTLNFLSLRGVFGSYDDAVFGLILITIMLLAPRGLIRWPGLRFLLSRKPHEKPSP